MNCRQCQQRLLTTERPESPGPKAQAHLAVCMACRQFQQHLVRIEANVPRLPLPPSIGKENVLREILGQPALPAPRPRLAKLPPSGDARATPLRQWFRRAQWTGAAAAAVVLLACGVWLGMWLARTAPPEPTGPGPQVKAPEEKSKTSSSIDPFAKKANAGNKKPDRKDTKQAVPLLADATPLVTKLMACDLKLAEAETTGERVKALAELADALQMETQLLSKSAPPAELNKLAVFFKKVIEDGVVARARDLPMGERVDVLKEVAAQLAKTTSETETLAQAAPQSAPALRMIAAAAREGDATLQKLMQEAAE
jgi:hypothetical protein